VGDGAVSIGVRGRMGALQRVERLGGPRVLMISGAICSDGGAVTV